MASSSFGAPSSDTPTSSGGSSGFSGGDGVGSNFHGAETSSVHNNGMVIAEEKEDEEECSVCFDKMIKPVRLSCGHHFCGGCLDNWRSKFGSSRHGGKDNDVWNKGCPLCRKKIPPSKEMIAQLNACRLLVEKCKEEEDEEQYIIHKAMYEKLKAKIGEYNENEVIGDEGQFSVELTDDMVAFLNYNDIRSIVNWVGIPADKKQLEAGYPILDQSTLLHMAAMTGKLELMSVLLQFGANPNAIDAKGCTIFDAATLKLPRDNQLFPSNTLETCKLILEWGGEVPDDQKWKLVILLRQYEDDFEGYHEGYDELADLLSTELGGRRCEIIGLQNRADLNGQTCLVDKYSNGRYKVVLESTEEEFAVKSKNLLRRDRTPTDCGYYIELKQGDSIRPGYAFKEASTVYATKCIIGTKMECDKIVKYTFASKEECQSFVNEVNTDEWVPVETKGEIATRELSDEESQKRMKEFRKIQKQVDEMIKSGELDQYIADNTGLDRSEPLIPFSEMSSETAEEMQKYEDMAKRDLGL